MDRTCNSHGVKLLDLCKSTCLRIVNGRLGNDHNIGTYTFVSQHGASVIDYLLTSDQHLSSIVRFSVDPISEWSDHVPLGYSIHCNNVKKVPDLQRATIHKWNDAFKNSFRTNLISQLPGLNDLTGILTRTVGQLSMN